MRISVIGNCQTESLCRTLAAMLPDDEIVGFFGTRHVDEISGSDILLTQGIAVPLVPKGILAEMEGRTFMFPEFYFSGYHPDVVVQHVGDQTLLGPGGMYNSSLVLHGFLERWSIEDTRSLFRGEVYDHLGFASYWGASVQSMVDEVDRCGLNGREMVSKWLLEKPLCYTPNHPKMSVVGHIARGLVDKIGLRPAARYPEMFTGDWLAAHGVWPIYPEIAKRLGVPGSLNFNFDTSAHFLKGVIGLDRFIEKSFEAYEKQAFARSDVQRLNDPRFLSLRPDKQTGRWHGLDLKEMQARIVSVAPQSDEIQEELGNAPSRKSGQIPRRPLFYRLRKDIASLFDAKFYRSRYPDIAASNLLKHFLSVGWKEQRSPSPLFDPISYGSHYPESLEHAYGPIGHFLTVGRYTNCDPHPLFELERYFQQFPEAYAAQTNPIVHYSHLGPDDRTATSAFFDPGYYAAKVDVTKPPLLDYLSEHRGKPHPYFDAEFYADRYQLPYWMPAINHFALHGGTYSCQPHKLFDLEVLRSKLPLRPNQNPLNAYFEWERSYIPPEVDLVPIRSVDRSIAAELRASSKVVCEEDLLAG